MGNDHKRQIDRNKARSHDIDQWLAEERGQKSGRLLLISSKGAHGSSYVKSLALQDQAGRSQSVYRNLLQCSCVAHAQELLQIIQSASPKTLWSANLSQATMDEVLGAFPPNWPPTISQSVQAVWQDEKVQKFFATRCRVKHRRRVCYIMDNTDHYFSHAPLRKEDILNCALPDKEVFEQIILCPPKLKMVRPWNLLWIHNPTMEGLEILDKRINLREADRLIFLVNIGSYYKPTKSQSIPNAIPLFSDLVEAFQFQDVILVFNHVDTFEEKQKTYPFENYFPSFSSWQGVTTPVRPELDHLGDKRSPLRWLSLAFLAPTKQLKTVPRCHFSRAYRDKSMQAEQVDELWTCYHTGFVDAKLDSVF